MIVKFTKTERVEDGVYRASYSMVDDAEDAPKYLSTGLVIAETEDGPIVQVFPASGYGTPESVRAYTRMTMVALDDAVKIESFGVAAYRAQAMEDPDLKGLGDWEDVTVRAFELVPPVNAAEHRVVDAAMGA